MKKIKGFLIATCLGLAEGAIGYFIVNKHLEKEGWVYNKDTKKYEIEAPNAFVKQAEAEEFKSNVYIAIGTISFITGLVVRKLAR